MKVTGKFTSTTQYGKHLFSIPESSQDFDKLLKLCTGNVLDEFKFKPVYVKEINDKKFITIIVDGLKYVLNNSDRGNVYSFTPQFRKVTKEDRTFLNVYASRLTLVERRKKFEPQGEIVEF